MATGVVETLVECAFKYVFPVVYGTIMQQFKERRKDVLHLDSVTEFWEGDLREGEYVSMEGALSVYAPLLIGPPKAKRELHRAYRRSIPEKDYKNIRTVVDAYLAFTAGQMVWRLNPKDSKYVLLGLYHSIVRNSIPVFVDRDYYFNTVQEIFSKGKSPHVVEAKVEGRVQQVPGSFISEIIENYKLEGLIRPEIIEAGKQVFAILVDGHDTSIAYSGAARYLDGDIWVAVDLNGQQFFVSRYVDLADPEDLHQESQALRKDVEEFLPQGNIVFQFDQVDRLITGYQKVTVDDLKRRFTQR